MTDPGNRVAGLFVIIVVLGVFAIIPLVAILAVNIVFSQEIAYSFVNWFWVLVLILMFGNVRLEKRQ